MKIWLFYIQNQRLNTEIEKFNLEEFLKDRVKYFELIAKTQNRELKLEVANNVFVNISKIESRTAGEYNNISNAIKYSYVDFNYKNYFRGLCFKIYLKWRKDKRYKYYF